MLSNCVNENNVYMFSYVFQMLCWFRAIKLFELFETQYSLALTVHKQPSVFNTTYKK